MTNARVKVLDNGYVQLVESWGSEERIIESARMSTGKGFNGWGPICEHCSGPLSPGGIGGPHCSKCGTVGGKPGDEKLLRYLWENKHATPFEMAGFTIEVQAPIFVFREWHRHRTQSYNEASARYEPLPDVNYIPSVERLMINAGGTNRQAGTVNGADMLDESGAEDFRDRLRSSYERSQELYEHALSIGVPKELARVHLPVGRYSRMRASTDLRNWFGFLTLRMDSKAQWEIRQFATIIGNSIVSQLFPRTWALYTERKA